MREGDINNAGNNHYMDNKSLLIGIGVLVILGVGGWYYMGNGQSKDSTGDAKDTTQKVVSQEKNFDLAYAQEKLTPNLVTVAEGDRVTLSVTADQKGEFHISGYEIENFIATPQTALSFSFAANKLGRYNLEWHPGNTPEEAANAEDLVVGALVVNPR